MPVMVVGKVILTRTVLIGSVWMTYAVQEHCTVNNYSIYKALNARKLGRLSNLNATRHDKLCACERKPNTKGEETTRDISPASRADLRTDVKRAHVVSHLSIGLVTVFFSMVCTVTVAGMRERSEKGGRRA
jgi:hypothetical protein